MRQRKRKVEKGSVRMVYPPHREDADTAFTAAAWRWEGRRRQRDVLCEVMLRASQCDSWLTLDELARLTHYPPSSISAQLRHLRKPEFGGFKVEKRPRFAGNILYGADFGTVWEYRLRQAVRRIHQYSVLTERKRKGHLSHLTER